MRNIMEMYTVRIEREIGYTSVYCKVQNKKYTDNTKHKYNSHLISYLYTYYIKLFGLLIYIVIYSIFYQLGCNPDIIFQTVYIFIIVFIYITFTDIIYLFLEQI